MSKAFLAPIIIALAMSSCGLATVIGVSNSSPTVDWPTQAQSTIVVRTGVPPTPTPIPIPTLTPDPAVPPAADCIFGFSDGTSLVAVTGTPDDCATVLGNLQDAGNAIDVTTDTPTDQPVCTLYNDSDVQYDIYGDPSLCASFVVY